MAMPFVHPSQIWATTSMSFSGGGTSLPHRANRAFICGYVLEHTITLVHPLPSY